MNEDIGRTAGQVWNLLSKQCGVTISKMKKDLGLKDGLLYMALGWLAREDKLCIDQKGNKTLISLK